MKKNDTIIVSLALIGGGAFLMADGIRRMLRRRRVDDMPTSKIGSAAQGLVELQGNAWPLARSAVPGLDGAALVYRRWRLEKLVKFGKSSSWVRQLEVVRGESFVIADATGCAGVDASECDLSVKPKTAPWTSLGPKGQRMVSAWVGSSVSGFPPSGWFGAKFRLVEHGIGIGSPLHLAGEFRSSSSPLRVQVATGLNAFVKQVTASPVHLMRRFDADRAGYVGTEEGEFVECAGTVRKSAGHALTLADCREVQLLKRVGSWNMTRVIGGALGIGLGVSLLLNDLRSRLP